MKMPLQRLVVLGATGSVGANTLAVVALHPTRFEIVALTAHARVDLLLEQCRQFRPRYAVMVDETLSPIGAAPLLILTVAKFTGGALTHALRHCK